MRVGWPDEIAAVRPLRNAMEAEEVFRREVVERHVLLALPRPALVEPEAVFAGTGGHGEADGRAGHGQDGVAASVAGLRQPVVRASG
ncbi:hypothetical protein [Microbispora sp. CA-102843]|uniref:hypothetical protein n=1 Tax=Microbispora sp. CA-102843 TaxID=3239952 RepID=UPI003D9123EF